MPVSARTPLNFDVYGCITENNRFRFSIFSETFFSFDSFEGPVSSLETLPSPLRSFSSEFDGDRTSSKSYELVSLEKALSNSSLSCDSVIFSTGFEPALTVLR